MVIKHYSNRRLLIIYLLTDVRADFLYTGISSGPDPTHGNEYGITFTFTFTY